MKMITLLMAFVCSSALADSKVLLTCTPDSSSADQRAYRISTMDLNGAQTLIVDIKDIKNPAAIPPGVPPLMYPLRTYNLIFNAGSLVRIEPKANATDVCADKMVGIVVNVDGIEQDNSTVCVSLNNRDFAEHLYSTHGPKKPYKCFR